MTKKNYEAAARIVQEVREAHGSEGKVTEDAFVKFFRDDSTRFDAGRFRAACVPGANVGARSTRTARLPHEASER